MNFIFHQMVKLQNRHHANGHRLVIRDTRLAIAQHLFTESRHRVARCVGGFLGDLHDACFGNPTSMPMAFNPQAKAGADRGCVILSTIAWVNILRMEDRIGIITFVTQPFGGSREAGVIHVV